MLFAGDGACSGDRVVDRRRAIAIAALIAFRATSSTSAARRQNDRKAGKDKKRSQGNKPQAGNADDVVRIAKKYKGAKYKWGGESPKGFDCSGFCWYVYQKATGIDIGHGVEAQWKQGRSVKRGSLKPGDVVFFKNTFERGLSHDGIYIGGDDFIHAENERTGVVISSLKSDYYDDHYAGARRHL